MHILIPFPYAHIRIIHHNDFSSALLERVSSILHFLSLIPIALMGSWLAHTICTQPHVDVIILLMGIRDVTTPLVINSLSLSQTAKKKSISTHIEIIIYDSLILIFIYFILQPLKFCCCVVAHFSLYYGTRDTNSLSTIRESEIQIIKSKLCKHFCTFVIYYTLENLLYSCDELLFIFCSYICRYILPAQGRNNETSQSVYTSIV